MSLKKPVRDPERIVDPNPKRAIVYIRVSKNLELQELGAKAQRNSCESWARQKGIEIMGYVEDEISGGKALTKRKKLHHALVLMREHNAGILLCSKVDRFGRNMVEALKAFDLIKARGGQLAFSEGPSPSDPTGELMFKMFLLMAEHELNMIRNRTADARRVLLERGLYPGGHVPFGYRKFQKESTPEAPWYIEEDPQEQQGLRRVIELRSQGYTWGACSRIAAREGLLVSNRGAEDNQPVSPAALFKRLQKVVQEGPELQFGQRIVDGKIEDHPEEQAVLAMILNAHRLGTGWHSITRALRENGVLTRAGKPPSWYWVREQIERLERQSGPLPGGQDEVAAALQSA